MSNFGQNTPKAESDHEQEAVRAEIRHHLKLVQPDHQETIRIAVIDDDEATLFYLAEFFRGRGHKVETFVEAQRFFAYLSSQISNNESSNAALNRSGRFPFDLVFSDIKMPGINGIELTRRVHDAYPEIPVVLITAFPDVHAAVNGMKEGAYDYVEKPFSLDRIDSVLKNALRLRQVELENRLFRQEGDGKLVYEGLPCESPSMKAIYDLIQRVAPSDSSVLITGESGVGKELVARAIHDNSHRKIKNFVSVNCSAIPESLLESELFGHAKGSFTGATFERHGLFEEANGGTLFLDEIGDLNMALQAKLLRVVQEKRIRAVGDNKSKPVDVRIISATNKNLVQETKNQHFREDLFYRLNVIPIHIPPLRQRKEDIPLLAKYFLGKFSTSYSKDLKGFTTGALTKLIHMPLKGNVRELQNVIERSVVLSQEAYIDEQDIPVSTAMEADEYVDELTFDLPSLTEVENRYIKSVLERYRGQKDVVAKILGLSRRTLYRRLNQIAEGEPPQV